MECTERYQLQHTLKYFYEKLLTSDRTNNRYENISIRNLTYRSVLALALRSHGVRRTPSPNFFFFFSFNITMSDLPPDDNPDAMVSDLSDRWARWAPQVADRGVVRTTTLTTLVSITWLDEKPFHNRRISRKTM